MLRRRLVVAVLVLVSLALLTVYFRESSGGGLHSLQSTGASVLRPFEVAASGSRSRSGRRRLGSAA